jgi:hypothetical protein
MGFMDGTTKRIISALFPEGYHWFDTRSSIYLVLFEVTEVDVDPRFVHLMFNGSVCFNLNPLKK